MESFVTVENISESDFLKLQSIGWVLVSVDNALSDNLIYSFKKEREQIKSFNISLVLSFQNQAFL